jgi:predicted regulator of Ras-like GTPase activity (Roadblock/LC7/MglB family)
VLKTRTALKPKKIISFLDRMSFSYLSFFIFCSINNLKAFAANTGSAQQPPAPTGGGSSMLIIAGGAILLIAIVVVAMMSKNKRGDDKISLPDPKKGINIPTPTSRTPVATPTPRVPVNIPSASAPGAPVSPPSNITAAPPAASAPVPAAATATASAPPVSPPASSAPAAAPVAPKPSQAPVASTPTPAPTPAVSASNQSSGKLFDSNKLDSDLDSIFTDPSAAKPESVPEPETQKKSPLFNSAQLDDDLDALFIEVNKKPAEKPVEEEKKGLFDASQLDSDLDSLFSETPAPQAKQESAPATSGSASDLSSLLGAETEKKEEKSAPAASNAAFDLDSLDFMSSGDSGKKTENKSESFSLPSLDLSSLTGGSDSAKKEENPAPAASNAAFDLDSLDFMSSGDSGKKTENKSESFSLPSLDLSSLTGSSPIKDAPKDVPPLVASKDKIDLSTTTMGLNISEYLSSIAEKKGGGEQTENRAASTFNLSDTIPPQSLNIADLANHQLSPVSEQLISETSSEAKKKQKGEGIIAIGKMLVDQNALEEIIKKAEKGGKAGLTTTQVITAVKGRSLDTLLVDINNIDGIMGSIIVGKDGLVIANTMPNEIDKDLVGALTSSLFSNIDVQVKKLKKGNLKRLTVETAMGTYILTEIEMGTLVVFSNEEGKINLNNVFKAITTVTGKR